MAAAAEAAAVYAAWQALEAGAGADGGDAPVEEEEVQAEERWEGEGARGAGCSFALRASVCKEGDEWALGYGGGWWAACVWESGFGRPGEWRAH